MTSRNFLLGGVVAGIVYFLLGWLTYGLLLKDLMDGHTSQGMLAIRRADEDFILWSMIIGNLGLGFLVSYVMSKSNAVTAMSGLITGSLVGFFCSVAFDFITYAQLNIGDMTGIWLDIATMTVVSGIAGGVTGFILSLAKRPVAAQG
ncbi:MAG TPA: hypothetical protein VF145_02400 [Chitinophagaceae bacterium]